MGNLQKRKQTTNKSNSSQMRMLEIKNMIPKKRSFNRFRRLHTAE